MTSAARLMNLSGSDEIGSTYRAVDCAAFITDEETRRTVEQACHALGKDVSISEGGSREAMEYLSEAPMPEVLIVDVSDTGKPLSTMLTITAAFAENTKVIAVGSVNDISLYRELIDGGVTDYLVKPITDKALSDAISRERNAPQPIEPALGEKLPANVIAFIGTRGGVGASTIAANCAWIVAQERKRQTTLLDLDLQFGTIALALDIEPTRGLREALENPSRIDSLFLSSAAAKLSDRFTVLAAEEAVDGEVHFDPSAIDQLLGEINRSSQFVFVDLPRVGSIGRTRLLQMTSQIVVVTDVTLAGLRDCIRLIAMLERAAPQAKLLVAANRAGRTENCLSKPEFEKALGRKVDIVLPEDPKALAASVNRGKPLPVVAKSSKFVGSLRQLVRRLDGADQPKPTQKATLPFMGLLKKKK
ncbi:MAG TPA: P-loop NTPase [Alphaproteobacteria bacterium]|nr:P-loop NTPase [Alphaproteobacteria bacterium]